MEENKRVLLGMSGGTDSSVAAMRLLEAGYEVIRPFSYGDSNRIFFGECCFRWEILPKWKHVPLLLNGDFRKWR